MPTPRTVAGFNVTQVWPNSLRVKRWTAEVIAGTTLQRAAPATSAWRKNSRAAASFPARQAAVGMFRLRVTRRALASPTWVWVLPTSNSAIIGP